jgi:hypothetical protein
VSPDPVGAYFGHQPAYGEAEGRHAQTRLSLPGRPDPSAPEHIPPNMSSRHIPRAITTLAPTVVIDAAVSLAGAGLAGLEAHSNTADRRRRLLVVTSFRSIPEGPPLARALELKPFGYLPACSPPCRSPPPTRTQANIRRVWCGTGRPGATSDQDMDDIERAAVAPRDRTPTTNRSSPPWLA